MPKAEYTFALDNDDKLYACLGRTAKYVFSKDHWEQIHNSEDYDYLFDYFSTTRIISTEEALKLANNIAPIDYYTVHKRVYLTEEDINKELKTLMQGRKYNKSTVKLVLESDMDTKVLVLEWLFKSPNLHELTIEMLIKNI
jgi:hypothetical protein